MRSSLTGLLGVGLVIACLFATPAPALEAGQLRGKIEEAFKLIHAARGPEAPPPLVYDGLEVEGQGQGEDGGEGFKVTLTGLRMIPDPAKAARLDIGSASFTMTPAGQRGGDELFQVSDLSLPPRWLYSEDGQSPSHVVKPGLLAFEGLWSFAYLRLMEGRFSASGAAVETAAGEPLAGFETILGDLASRPVEKERYDIDARLQVEGVTLRDDDLRVSLGRVDGKVEVPDHDPAAVVAVLRQAAEGAPEGTAEEASTSLVTDLLTLSQGGRMAFEFRDFRGARKGSQEALEIDSVSLGYAVSDLEESVAKLDLALAQTGLRITAPDLKAEGLAAALMPADGSAVLSLERIPLRSLLALLEPLAEEVEGEDLTLGGPKSERLAAEAGEKLIGAMSAAGTTLDLSGTRFAAPDAEVALKGGLVIDAGAAFGVRGTVLAEVGGFDALLELAQQSLADPDQKIRDNARGAVTILVLLKAFAERDESGAEGPVDRFLVKVEPDGALSVNDKLLLPPQPSH